MKTPLLPVLLVSVLVAISGCGRKEPGAVTPVKPARETSFDAVTRQLDPGGTIYAYLSTDQWLAGLSTNIARFGALLDQLPGDSPVQTEQAHRILDLVTRLVRTSGVESLDGVGLSGVQITPELFRTKIILHHDKSGGEGFLWNVTGKEAHALAGLDLLTTNTALAAFGDLDFTLLWEIASRELRDVPELAETLRNWPQMFEQMTQVSWTNLLNSLAGELGIVLTLSDTSKVPLPGELNMELPEPGLLFAIKVNNDLLYDRLSAELRKNEQAEVVEEPGLKMTSMQLPLPLPVQLNVTVASADGYVFLASSQAMVRDALAVRSGTQPGLRKSPEVAELLKYLPESGNQFAYVGQRLTRTIQDFQKAAFQQAEEDMEEGQAELLRKLFLNKAATFGLSIGSRTDTGWQTVSVGNEDSATTLVAAPAVGVVAMTSAMLLPALAKAKHRAKSVQCINNMKQIGLALLIWSGDHDDAYPFNVGPDKGGTMGLSDRGPDGLDRASWRHFKALADFLGSARILVCPDDASKHEVESFDDLGPQNVSYRLRTESSVRPGEADAVVITCPVHSHKGYADGSVRTD